MEELEGLSAEQLDQELAAVPSTPVTTQKQPAASVPSLPSAPTSAPVQQQSAPMDEEEQALLELQRQMMLA